MATTAALLLGALLPAPQVRAADPTRQAQEQLAAEHNGSANDFEVVYERAVSTPVAGGPTWATKLVDRRTGEIHTVYNTPASGAAGVAALDDAVAAARLALPTLDQKADAPLLAAVARAAPTKPLGVAVWLDVDTAAVEEAVRAAHPEVEWLGERPVPSTIEQARALRGELWEARRGVYEVAAAAFGAEVQAAGGSVAYASTSAPLVFVDLPPTAVEAVAGLPAVMSMGLEAEWRTSMSSAGVTVDASWTGGAGDQGNGVRVAVVEYHNAAGTGDLAGQVVATYSTTGATPTHIHPTWVAGAIASRNGTYAGVAPGADIVTAGTGGYTPGLSTDRAIIAAADWAVSPFGGDADIINTSIGQDTATGAEEARRYFDSVGWEDGRLVVAASGNFSTFGNWDVVSPGTGYNVLTVGGINDRNTGGRGDDVLWYVPGSDGANYRDRTDASWNTHGDYNKPNLSAPAVSVRTANGIFGDGTSIASPIVAGIGAQLLARAPSLASWPEGSRAILMASAFRRTPMPDGSINPDHEGVGAPSALWANRIVDNGPFGGYAIGSMRAGQTIVRDIPVVAGQAVNVALAWSSHTSGTSNTAKADQLTADLDLRVIAPNGAVYGSFTWDNPYEALGFYAPSTGTMRIEVRHDRFDAAEEPYGLAWTLQSPFGDSESSPFYTDILWVAGQGITLGCAAGRYCPRSVVARDQMASFLVRALNLPASGTDFFDDDAGNGHQGNINALAAAGVTEGCAHRRYCPRSGVNREQMATFLVRALNLPPSGHDYFTDDAGSGHQAAINALAAAGVTNGCGGGRYCPREYVTREQMAAFLHRALTP